MKYTIVIEQYMTCKAFPDENHRPDLVDLAILDYIQAAYASLSQKMKRVEIDGKIFVWVNYQHLINEMPLLGINSKRAIVNRIKRLRDFGLIETYLAKEEGNKLYVRLTKKAIEILFTKVTEPIEEEEKEETEPPGESDVTGEAPLVNEMKHPGERNVTGDTPLVNENSPAPRDNHTKNEDLSHKNKKTDRLVNDDSPPCGTTIHHPGERRFTTLVNDGSPDQYIKISILDQPTKSVNKAIGGVEMKKLAAGISKSVASVPPKKVETLRDFVSALKEMGFSEEEIGEVSDEEVASKRD